MMEGEGFSWSGNVGDDDGTCTGFFDHARVRIISYLDRRIGPLLGI